MFGKNPIRKLDQSPDDGKLAIQEIFYTIQGEGPLSGMPAVFVRLAGCHLACTFCDTEFESGIDNRLSITKITDQILSSLPKPSDIDRTLIVLTGGEPLRQNVVPLVRALVKLQAHQIQIETAGNLWAPGLEEFVMTGACLLVCSPKTSHLHQKIVEWCEHWKYVVRAGAISELTGLPTEATQANGGGLPRGSLKPGGHIWLSPMDEHDPFKNAANVKAAVATCMKHGYRLSLQLHKILGMP